MVELYPYLLGILNWQWGSSLNVQVPVRQTGQSWIHNPDSKVHGANMGPIWGWQDPGGSLVGPMNFAIWEATKSSEVCWHPKPNNKIPTLNILYCYSVLVLFQHNTRGKLIKSNFFIWTFENKFIVTKPCDKNWTIIANFCEQIKMNFLE